MFTVKLPRPEGEEQYKVYFTHIRPNSTPRPIGLLLEEDVERIIKRNPGATTCSITVGPTIHEQAPLVSFGVAVCHTEDRFVKAEGRKTSFTRAISPFGREDRRIFWQQFHEMGL